VRSQMTARSARTFSARGKCASLIFIALVLTGMAVASSALGATVYRPVGEPFAGPGSGPGEVVGQLGQAAVDDATGAVLLGTGGSVKVFAPAESSTVYQTTLGEGELQNPYQVAIDQTSRSVYVGDLGLGQILKYDISGSDPLTFTPDPSYVGPVQGSGPGEIANFFGAKLAVDPTSGNLLVADRAGEKVNRYAADGSFLSSFDGSDSTAGSFHGLSSIAVDASGSIYIVDVTVPNIDFEYGKSVLERFAPDGTADNSFAPEIPTPRTVTTDPTSGNVVVAGRSDGTYEHVDGTEPYPIRLYTLHDGLVIDELDLGTPGSTITGMAIGGGASKRLYVLSNSGGAGGSLNATALETFKAPDLTFDEPTAVTAVGAHVTGTANPLGQASSYHFEYSREGGPWQSTSTVALGEGEVPVAVEADLTGLIANSDYEIRLVATATATSVTIVSTSRHFQTAVSVPRVLTGDAIDRMSMSVTLLGRVNPFGMQTSYRFEYGPTASYGLRGPVDHDDVAGNGRDALSVHAYLANLQPGTEYHYRLVAENSAGVSAGADRTFVTLGPVDRVYEQVTPVNKGGSEVNGLRSFYASADGEGLMYQWKAAPANGLAGSVQPRSVGWRGAAGWSSLSLDPPQLAGTPIFANAAITYVGGISDDASKAVVFSLRRLAPGATDGDSNVYLVDTRSGDYTTMFSVPGTSVFTAALALGGQIVVDGTPDYSRVLFRPTFYPLLPGAPEGALYEWNEGQLRIASVAPDETPVGDVNAGGNTGWSVHDPHYISADGSKIFFTRQSVTYVRIDDEETVLIGGVFGGATKDGHYAFVYGTEMTPDSEPGIPSLYRFDTDTRQLELLTPVGSLEGHLQASSDGASVFFVSSLALTPDAVAGDPNLYVWHGGGVQLMAGRNGQLDGPIPPEFIASASGRYFAFSSYSRLTDYDNRSQTACVEFNGSDPKDPATGKGVACRQVYRYDVESDELLCASCPRDGSAPFGTPRLTSDNVEGDFSFNRSMLDNGMVIFDTPQPLSSRDSNSNRDVYTFNGEETTLISAGRANVSSQFDAASADGRDIFFSTPDQLVGQDDDSLADVYDARIGGGIPGQNPPPPRGECIRDDCKATPNRGPELPFGGSEGLNGPENVKTQARKRCGKGRHVRRANGGSRCVKSHRKQAKNNRRQGR
jgi:hypothetical protein